MIALYFLLMQADNTVFPAREPLFLCVLCVLCGSVFFVATIVYGGLCGGKLAIMQITNTFRYESI